ncbi:hypothetical protein [Acinetobacter beijerinckii]|uniref:Uncharacterized protein n=1 Tax=Acinetobacter beijerinckii ANC 3835 TaxID=1217649 RepID=N9FLM6_9GAMM|nr:hypothetical protein [Acinetobacter beijerinckii]ENW05754.1 hypothetical protein F934_01111 [Acinetobacter beijerinckii ANC 3835]
MVASTDIKFYVHTNTNAPQLQNVFGCMIDVLDACLVNGFGSQSVATLTASGTTVTATYGSGHNYLQYQVTKIAGVNQTEFNGEHRILTVPNANTITFQLASAPTVTTATGTITSSLPQLGWLKPFSGTGKAAYRSSNTLLASRPYLRVIDALDPAYTSTYAKYAKVGIVEDMSDIDTMFGVQAPYESTAPDRNWTATGSGATVLNGWSRWYYATSVAGNTTGPDTTAPANGNRSWILVGNKDYFFILPSTTSLDTNALTYGFGAFQTLLNSDSANTFLSSTLNYVAANSSFIKGSSTSLASAVVSDVLLLQRKYTNESISNNASVLSLGITTNMGSGTTNYLATVATTSTIPQSPIFIKELTNVLRGQIPNFNWLFQIKPYSNLQSFEKNGQIFIAKDVAAANQSGQILLKIGDL